MGGSGRDNSMMDDEHATIARSQDLIRLAGSVSVPALKRGAPWDEVLRETRRARAASAGMHGNAND